MYDKYSNQPFKYYKNLKNQDKVNLGLIATVEKNGKRAFNDQDKFSFHIIPTIIQQF
jgi:hypothetical protein